MIGTTLGASRFCSPSMKLKPSISGIIRSSSTEAAVYSSMQSSATHPLSASTTDQPFAIASRGLIEVAGRGQMRAYVLEAEGAVALIRDRRISLRPDTRLPILPNGFCWHQHPAQGWP